MVNTDFNKMSVNINVNDYSKQEPQKPQNIDKKTAEIASEIPDLKEIDTSYKNYSAEGDKLSVTKMGDASNKLGGTVTNLSEDGVVMKQESSAVTSNPAATGNVAQKASQSDEESASKKAAEKASEATKKAEVEKEERAKSLAVAKEANEKAIEIREASIENQEKVNDGASGSANRQKRIITEDSPKLAANKEKRGTEQSTDKNNSYAMEKSEQGNKERQLSSGELVGKSEAQIQSLYSQGKISEYTRDKAVEGSDKASEDGAISVSMPRSVMDKANITANMEALSGKNDNENANFQGSKIVASLLGASEDGSVSVITK